jgi:hypothetical protein
LPGRSEEEIIVRSLIDVEDVAQSSDQQLLQAHRRSLLTPHLRCFPATDLDVMSDLNFGASCDEVSQPGGDSPE